MRPQAQFLIARPAAVLWGPATQSSLNGSVCVGHLVPGWVVKPGGGTRESLTLPGAFFSQVSSPAALVGAALSEKSNFGLWAHCLKHRPAGHWPPLKRAGGAAFSRPEVTSGPAGPHQADLPVALLHQAHFLDHSRKLFLQLKERENKFLNFLDDPSGLI